MARLLPLYASGSSGEKMAALEDGVAVAEESSENLSHPEGYDSNLFIAQT